MNNTLNALQNNNLGAKLDHAPQHVINAISDASQASGVDFSYLVQQAAAESNFDADAKAKTSSATGLYQFIDSTWLSMINRYGEDFGIDTKGMSRAEILNLRNDPKSASFMAAAFASENEKTLEAHWGGEIGSTELYFAHFMGAGGASEFLKALDENPIQNAADLFPREARANRNVFYDRQTGESRTLEEVYQFFDKKFQNTFETPVQQKQTEPVEAIAHNSLFHPDMNHPIMSRAQEMRDTMTLLALNNSSMNNLYANNRTEGFQKQNSLFTGLLASPLDLLLLTQDVTNQASLSKDEA